VSPSSELRENMGTDSVAKVFVLTLLCAFILLVALFWAYVPSIILAFFIASTFYPLYAWMKKILGGRERLASLVVSLFILLVLIIPVGGFVGSLSKEAVELYGRTKDSVSLKKLQEMLQGDSIWAQRLRRGQKMLGVKFTATGAIENLAASTARTVGIYLSGQVTAMGANLLSFLVHFLVMMLIIYYIFYDGIRFRDYISDLLPFPVAQQNLMVGRFREMARAIIFGNGMNGVLQGILGGLGFLLFGLGSPILWGTFIAFSAFLPLLGATIVYVPAAVVLLIQGKKGLAIGFLIYNACYSLIMENVVKPKLIGKEMRMNSLLVFIGILGGMKLFGILGIIYGPLIMTVFLTLSDIYRMEYRDKLGWRNH